jgi:ABC-type Fe3+-siderophore transport system permease subunit
MSKRIPAADPPPRIIHYIQPAPPAVPVDVAAHHRDQQRRYDRWRTRQHAIRRRDRTVRWALLVVAVVIGVALLAAGAALAWTVYQAFTDPGTGGWSHLGVGR